MKSTSVALHCGRVTKSIAGRPVLGDISFSAYRGETLALIGPNGSGKTTLLKTLGGLIGVDDGQIDIFGRAMNAANRDDLLHGIGMLIGTPVFERGLTVQTAMRKHLAFMGCDQAPDEVLERVGLTAQQDKLAGILSMGNRMRLALAMALSHHPGLLLLDEPMNGLDPTGMSLLRQIIREENRQSVTVVVSAHMLAELRTFSDRVMVLSHGVLRAQSDMADVDDLESYYFRYTRDR